MDKKAMYKLSYGLFVLTTNYYGRDNGCIINTAIQAASSPNQLSICVNKANLTHDMINLSGEAYTIEPGERVAQLMFVPVFHASLIPSDSLDETERGNGGFGSTGTK